MNYDDFKQAFKAEVMIRSGSGVEISEHVVHKTNESLEALSVRPTGSNIASQIYFKDYYSQHEDGAGIAFLAEDAVRKVMHFLGRLPEIPEMSHTFMEENLYLTVMNPEMNRDYLSDVPCDRLEDMAVVPRVRVNEESSFVVRDWMMREYGFSKDALFKAARANMDRQDYRCFSLSSFVSDLMMEEPDPGPSDSIYVLTNMTAVDGAAAILSDKAMKEARDKVGEDFFILPSSRHEVILVPRSSSLSVADLTDMVMQANRTVVEDKDLLSDHVYRYNSSKGTIKMIEPKEEARKLDRALPPVL